MFGCIFHQKVNQHFLSLGYQFDTIIAISTAVSPFAQTGTGCQILHSVIIQAGATLCGQVSVGESTYVGAGVTVIQETTLAADCIVGEGSTVLSDVHSNTITYSKLNQKNKLIEYDK